MQQSFRELLVAGVDEAGRGPLAGPVTAAAVILPGDHSIIGLADSKKLSEPKRDSLAVQIKAQAVAWCVTHAEVEEIDQYNILQACLRAMQRAVAGLARQPDQVLVDGNQCPPFGVPARAIIGGDDLEPAISAASILAKVTRDAEMHRLDEVYPGYGFAKHKGYGTAVHKAALAQLGATPIHRRSFAPIRAILDANKT